MGVEDRVHELVAPLFDERGVELVDVVHEGAVLRVCADQPGGIDLETLQDLSRAVSRLLDEADPLPGRYTLEVSSPGLERPLRTPRHFAGAVGQPVKIRTRPEVDGERRADGQLVTADDDGIEVLLDDGSVRRLAYDDIERARTVFEWGPAPKPGKGGGNKPGKGGGHKRKATA